MDEVFAELYELLDLYFQTQIKITNGYVKADRNYTDNQKTLDYYIFKDELKERILLTAQHLHLL